MKTFALCLCFCACLLLPSLSRAELLIYKGVEKDSFTGLNRAERISWKIFVIVDHGKGFYARIAYATLAGGVKHYSTVSRTNSHIVQVTGANGKLYSVLAHIPTECEASENPGREGVYLQGPNANLTVNTNKVTSAFARTFSDHGLGLAHSSSSGEPYISDGAVVLVFNQAETVASNSAGE